MLAPSVKVDPTPLMLSGIGFANCGVMLTTIVPPGWFTLVNVYVPDVVCPTTILTTSTAPITGMLLSKS